MRTADNVRHYGGNCRGRAAFARTLEKVNVLEGWGSGFQRINTLCQEYGVALPEFTEIGDMFRVNFYRHNNDEKVAINLKSGDKTAINPENGDESGEKVAIKNRQNSRKRFLNTLLNTKNSFPRTNHATPKT